VLGIRPQELETGPEEQGDRATGSGWRADGLSREDMAGQREKEGWSKVRRPTGPVRSVGLGQARTGTWSGEEGGVSQEQEDLAREQGTVAGEQTDLARGGGGLRQEEQAD
jgi:hypothetical protein